MLVDGSPTGEGPTDALEHECVRGLRFPLWRHRWRTLRAACAKPVLVATAALMLCMCGECLPDDGTAAEVFERFKASVAQLDGLLFNSEATYSTTSSLVNPSGEKGKPSSKRKPLNESGQEGGTPRALPPTEVTLMLGPGCKVRADVKSLGEDSRYSRRIIGYNGEKTVSVIPGVQAATISQGPSEAWGLGWPQQYTWASESMYPRSKVLAIGTISNLSLSEGRLSFDIALPQPPELEGSPPSTTKLVVDADTLAVLQETVYLGGCVWWSMEYSDFRDVKGVLFPYSQRRYAFDLEAGVRDFDPENPVPLWHADMKVEVKEIRLDLTIDPGMFEPEIPDGYKVFDGIRNVQYVQGAVTKTPDEVAKSIVDDLLETQRAYLVEEVPTDAGNSSANGDSAPATATGARSQEPDDGEAAGSTAGASRYYFLVCGGLAVMAGVVILIKVTRR